MTSEGLGEMFEGDSADTSAANFRSCRWGSSRGFSVRRPGSEDPHRRERNFFHFFLLLLAPIPFLPEGVVVGFQYFAWAFKLQK